MREPKTIQVGTLRQVADVEVDNRILVFLELREKTCHFRVHCVRRSVDEWHFGHRFFVQLFIFGDSHSARAVHNKQYNIVSSFKHNHKNI